MCLQITVSGKSSKKYGFKAGYYRIVGGVSVDTEEDV